MVFAHRFECCIYCIGLGGGTTPRESPMMMRVLWFWGLTWGFWVVFEGIIFWPCKLLQGKGFGEQRAEMAWRCATAGWVAGPSAAAGAGARQPSLRMTGYGWGKESRFLAALGMTTRKAKASARATTRQRQKQIPAG